MPCGTPALPQRPPPSLPPCCLSGWAFPKADGAAARAVVNGLGGGGEAGSIIAPMMSRALLSLFTASSPVSPQPNDGRRLSLSPHARTAASIRRKQASSQPGGRGERPPVEHPDRGSRDGGWGPCLAPPPPPLRHRPAAGAAATPAFSALAHAPLFLFSQPLFLAPLDLLTAPKKTKNTPQKTRACGGGSVRGAPPDRPLHQPGAGEAAGRRAGRRMGSSSGGSGSSGSSGGGGADLIVLGVGSGTRGASGGRFFGLRRGD